MRLRFDFSQAEKTLDVICSQANDRLLVLLSDDSFVSFRENVIEPFLDAVLEPLKESSDCEITRDKKPKRVKFQLRLGRTRLTLEEIAALNVDTIVPLLDSTNGQVQIWSNEKLIGHGILRVVQGKLVVKVVSLER